ncbi:MAG TPA: hypothetical protein VFU47_16195, partial [Armatimonadota bacterium]|nr:hypothetical protein [Armatimonadota bacterium]
MAKLDMRQFFAGALGTLAGMREGDLLAEQEGQRRAAETAENALRALSLETQAAGQRRADKLDYLRMLGGLAPSLTPESGQALTRQLLGEYGKTLGQDEPDYQSYAGRIPNLPQFRALRDTLGRLGADTGGSSREGQAAPMAAPMA